MKKENKSKLTIDLENILTVDGRGRPKKAKMLIEMLENMDRDILMKELKEISERRFF